MNKNKIINYIKNTQELTNTNEKDNKYKVIYNLKNDKLEKLLKKNNLSLKNFFKLIENKKFIYCINRITDNKIKHYYQIFFEKCKSYILIRKLCLNRLYNVLNKTFIINKVISLNLLKNNYLINENNKSKLILKLKKNSEKLNIIKNKKTFNWIFILEKKIIMDKHIFYTNIKLNNKNLQIIFDKLYLKKKIILLQNIKFILRINNNKLIETKVNLNYYFNIFYLNIKNKFLKKLIIFMINNRKINKNNNNNKATLKGLVNKLIKNKSDNLKIFLKTYKFNKGINIWNKSFKNKINEYLFKLSKNNKIEKVYKENKILYGIEMEVVNINREYNNIYYTKKKNDSENFLLTNEGFNNEVKSIKSLKEYYNSYEKNKFKKKNIFLKLKKNNFSISNYKFNNSNSKTWMSKSRNKVKLNEFNEESIRTKTKEKFNKKGFFKTVFNKNKKNLKKKIKELKTYINNR